jgi:hypothetical protein
VLAEIVVVAKILREENYNLKQKKTKNEKREKKGKRAC